ncbi:hypothetical protein [Anaerotruncus rubiinfantis]|uniref:hypothetical protein n=1 Tax=Anaerotruncus rubiinfantis TaxID=1720200 RepID=UPI00189C0996|nr:hypothetical protein [Anaerotruncus rubiinfantis]
MQIFETYRMTTPTRTIDLGPGARPEEFADGEPYELVPSFRLVAAPGMLLTNGSEISACVICEDADGWGEIPDPEG